MSSYWIKSGLRNRSSVMGNALVLFENEFTFSSLISFSACSDVCLTDFDGNDSLKVRDVGSSFHLRIYERQPARKLKIMT